MRLSFRDRRVAVYDDFLATEDQAHVLTYLDRAQFRAALPETWGSAYRLGDGPSLVGSQIFSGQLSEEKSGHVYPTDTALDILVERLMNERSNIEAIIGPFGESWSIFSMAPFIYPASASLSWHSDAHCAGAFVYYAHSSWNVHWGGELVIEWVDRDCEPPSTSSRGMFRSKEIESALENGMGYYFAPTPNRMIFIRGGTPHMIKKVEAAAGDNLRISLSGFFFCPPKNGIVPPGESSA